MHELHADAVTVLARRARAQHVHALPVLFGFVTRGKGLVNVRAQFRVKGVAKKRVSVLGNVRAVTPFKIRLAVLVQGDVVIHFHAERDGARLGARVLGVNPVAWLCSRTIGFKKIVACLGVRVNNCSRRVNSGQARVTLVVELHEQAAELGVARGNKRELRLVFVSQHQGLHGLVQRIVEPEELHRGALQQVLIIHPDGYLAGFVRGKRLRPHHLYVSA